MGVVKALRQKQIEIRDLDEVTMREEVANALRHQFADYEVCKDSLQYLRRTHCGTQTGKTSMPLEFMQSVVELDQI